MGFEVSLPGKVGSSVCSELDELVGGAALRETADGLIVSVADQAALVGLIDWLHDAGVAIGEVRSGE